MYTMTTPKTPKTELSSLLDEGDCHQSNQPWSKLIGVATAAVGIGVICGTVLGYAVGSHSSQPEEGATPVPLLSQSAAIGECVSMCVGVYDSTCMVVGNPDFPFPDGILGGLVLSTPGNGGGIDYHLLSIDSDYLGPKYLEYGHYSLDELQTPNATHNCVGQNDLFFHFVDDGDEWSPLHLDMKWNSRDGGDSFFLGTNNGFGCRYVKISGDACPKTYNDIVNEFDAVGMKLNVPSVHEMCG